ncbi:hypothetical protein ACIMWO_002673 [Staphylococcus aureus]
MLKTYTEIIGSELPIYITKSETSELLFSEELDKNWFCCKVEFIV